MRDVSNVCDIPNIDSSLNQIAIPVKSVFIGSDHVLRPRSGTSDAEDKRRLDMCPRQSDAGLPGTANIDVEVRDRPARRAIDAPHQYRNLVVAPRKQMP
jgi:hypothetical protein